MTTIINADRIKIYRHYGGDIDGILKINKKAELEKFGSDLDSIWSKITSILQDMGLVEKGLTSKENTEKILIEIKALCDNAAYEETIFSRPNTKSTIFLKAGIIRFMSKQES